MSGEPSSNQPNRQPIWFLLLGLGGPIVGGLTIAQTVTQHLWEALGIALLYVIIVLILGIVTKVWEQLENNWVSRIVAWVNIPLNYQKRYCQWFIGKHDVVDVKGLSTYSATSQKLKQVFVELNLAIKPPHEISSAVFKASNVPNPDQHPISYYIRQGHLVLLGQPGSGKTTLLKRLGLRVIDRMNWSKKAGITYKLPFFLSLRDYSGKIEEPELFSIIDAIQASLREVNLPAPPGWIEGHLNKGHCLVLLDGLDEVPDEESRLAMVEWVQRQMSRYGRSNRFILTSRPLGYPDNPLNGVTVLEVQGFTYNQIKWFVRKWYHADEENRSKQQLESLENVGLGAEDFLGKLNNTPTLLDLARNPLLLTMSILVHCYRGALPGSRGELYKEICEVFLGKRQRAKELKLELSPEQNQWVLQPLAFHMMNKGKTALTLTEAQSIIEEPLRSVNTQLKPQKFLKIVEDSNFWVKQGYDVYGFAHLSFQEYLAAMHVKEKNLVQEVLVDQIGSSWWRETIVLYCNRADASPILKACLTKKPLSVPALQLAFECKEAALRSSSISDPFVRNLLENVSQWVEDEEQEIRQIVGEAILAERIRNMIILDDYIYIDTSLINCAEYQLFLDEQQKQGKYYQPDHWTKDRFSPGEGLKPVLGVRPSDALAFCAWLTEREHEKKWYYRLPRASELGKMEGIVVIQSGAGYWIDEGEEFIWATGNTLVPSTVDQEHLNRSFTDDTNHILKYPLKPDNDNHRALAEYIKRVRNLADARSLNDELVRVLTSIRSRVRNRESVLRDQLDRDHKDTSAWQDRLNKFEAKERSLQTRRTRYWAEESGLSAQLDNLLVQEREAKDKLNNLDKDKRKTRFDFTFSDKNEIVLKSQYPSISEQRNELLATLVSVQKQQDDFQTPLAVAQEKERDLQTEIASVQEQEASLQPQLDKAREKENNSQTQLESFRANARAFYSTCEHLLAFAPTYNSSNALSHALSHNNVLNLDRVLVSIDNGVSSEVLIYVSRLVSTFTRELARNLEHFRNNADIGINDHDHTKPNSIALAYQLCQTSFSENVQNLALILTRYLDYLTERRPFGRRSSLVRLCIRYFARELALHFSYWSWKELFLDTEQSSHFMEDVVPHIIDTYFDVYVAFAILEERIEGRLSASEGILIVKERVEES